MPDRASSAVQPVGAPARCQSRTCRRCSRGASELDSVGSVRSMLMSLAVSVRSLPALSVPVPLTDSPAPSADRVVVPDEVSIVDKASSHVKVTSTGPLFQPSALAAGVRSALDGRSGLVDLDVRTDTLSLFPATSVAVPVAD